MNLAMENTREYVAGVLRREYGDCFIRGNNGMSNPMGLASRSTNFVPSHVYLCLMTGMLLQPMSSTFKMMSRRYGCPAEP